MGCGGGYGGYIFWQESRPPAAVPLAASSVAVPPAPEPQEVAVVNGMATPNSRMDLVMSANPRDDLSALGRDQSLSARDMERESGVKVNRPSGTEAAGLFISVPSASQQESNAFVSVPVAPDQRLLERTRFGLVPRVGADGARAAQIYARPVVSAGTLRATAPRIALMVGGMGINKALTYAAMDRLPAAVTLAFAPYGDELENLAQKARERGHEVMLQMPMEPFEAADIPGPHTLISGETAQQNIDHAQWLMARFTAYVGVSNFLGAKMMAQSASLAPVLREIAQRGLLFVDDGSSVQSVALEVAQNVALPAAKADVILDGAKPEAIEALIARLEAVARDKGRALGVATGSGLIIERLSAFARSLEGRGILLVPVSGFVDIAPASSRARLAR